MTDESPLRRALVDAAEESGVSLKDLTVLATQNDPFRIDTPARHRDGEWLAVTAKRLLGDQKIHPRGLHYAVLGKPKPDGTPYTNTEADWTWLSEDACKAARWLGYVPFDRITDQRNDAPTVRLFTPSTARPYISVGVEVDIPDADDIEPYVAAYYMDQGTPESGFQAVQPYKLVLVGEKSSLEPVLGPIARQYKADLYLPTGEPSDTMLYQMARVGNDDGRPMVVLYFSDCDPSGWQMPISVGRKLQAFKELEFPLLDFLVYRVALTPDQVREYGLPSTPLKDTEKRADKWQQSMGVAQTEIDALASLRPDLLRRIARDAIARFYDATLDERVKEAYDEWQVEAQAALDATLDADQLEILRTQAAEKLGELREQIDAINNALRVDPGGVDLPAIDVPTAEVVADPDMDSELDFDGEVYGKPLLDSRWDFADQCHALIDSKAYRGGGA